MKVLFLDVDGVLNSERSFLARAGKLKGMEKLEDDFFVRMTKTTIDPIAVELINRICDELDVKLVISSSHRGHFPDDEQKLTNMRHYFDALGIHGSKHIIGWTARLWGDRGTEIAAWVNDHPEITHYAIVDDSSDMLESQLPFFIHVDGSKGFSAENYRDTCMLFGRHDFEHVFL